MFHASQKNIPTIIAVILFLGLYGGAIFYTKQLEHDVRTRTSELATEVTREASMERLGGFLDELAKDQMRLSDFFVSPKDAVLMIEQVEALGDVVGVPVVISGVSLVDENAETGEGTMVMKIGARGTWRAMSHLLALLDTFPFVSHVESVSLLMSEPEKKGGAPLWSFRGELHLSLRNH